MEHAHVIQIAWVGHNVLYGEDDRGKQPIGSWSFWRSLEMIVVVFQAPRGEHTSKPSIPTETRMSAEQGDHHAMSDPSRFGAVSHQYVIAVDGSMFLGVHVSIVVPAI